jgi:6,7-dimethyl-8-ribityllumazine synthase
MASRGSPHILILEARFYDDLTDALAAGAIAALEAVGATYERISVPGALEIPVALSMAIEAGLFEDEEETHSYDGCIALGCVIRGETYHFEIVANEAVRALMQLVTDEGIPLGNGVLTVESSEQAWARAKGTGAVEDNKGGDAARACLRLIDVRDTFDALAGQGNSNKRGPVS